MMAELNLAMNDLKNSLDERSLEGVAGALANLVFGTFGAVFDCGMGDQFGRIFQELCRSKGTLTLRSEQEAVRQAKKLHKASGAKIQVKRIRRAPSEPWTFILADAVGRPKTPPCFRPPAFGPLLRRRRDDDDRGEVVYETWGDSAPLSPREELERVLEALHLAR